MHITVVVVVRAVVALSRRGGVLVAAGVRDLLGVLFAHRREGAGGEQMRARRLNEALCEGGREACAAGERAQRGRRRRTQRARRGRSRIEERRGE